MTSAADRLARARAELAEAERIDSPEIDRALAEVEAAEQDVENDSVCPNCQCEDWPECPLCAEDCEGDEISG